MKVCYSNPTLLMRRPISEISRRVSKKKNFDVSVLSPRNAFSKKDDVLHHEGSENVSHYATLSLPFLQSDYPIPNPFFLFTAWKTWRENDAVHMWVPLYVSHIILALMKLVFFRDKRLVLTMDTVQGFSHSRGALDRVFRVYYATLGKLVFMAADVITLYDEKFKEYALNAGVPEDKIRITPTGVMGDLPAKDKSVKEELDIEGKVVLFVGLMVDRKGIDTILDVAEFMEGVNFVLVGDGPKKKYFENNASENVFFTGFRKDVHNFYREADVLLFPSRGEGLSGVVMEALVCEVPVVASDIPGNSVLIEDGKTGFLCPEYNVECFVGKLEEILDSAKMSKRISSAAKKRIKKEFSWEKNFKSFVEVLKSS